jgi:hypothetical protein
LGEFESETRRTVAVAGYRGRAVDAAVGVAVAVAAAAGRGGGGGDAVTVVGTDRRADSSAVALARCLPRLVVPCWVVLCLVVPCVVVPCLQTRRVDPAVRQC